MQYTQIKYEERIELAKLYSESLSLGDRGYVYTYLDNFYCMNCGEGFNFNNRYN